MKGDIPMSEYSEFKQELLKNPAVKAEYDALAPEYDIIQAMIDARKEQNLTQKDLSIRTGIPQADISRIENGNRNPSLNMLKKLAKGLGMTLKVEFVAEGATHWFLMLTEFVQTATGTDFEINENCEVIDMCRAWKNSMKQAEDKGREAERKDAILYLIASIKDISASQTQAVEQLMKRYSLTKAEAQATVQANW